MDAKISTSDRHVSRADNKACKKLQEAHRQLGIPREDRHTCHRYFIVGSDGSLQETPY